MIVEVSYNQGAQRQIARQLIEHALVTVYAQDTPFEQVPIPLPTS